MTCVSTWCLSSISVRASPLPPFQSSFLSFSRSFTFVLINRFHFVSHFLSISHTLSLFLIHALYLSFFDWFWIGGIMRNVLSPVLSGGCVITCSGFDPLLFWYTPIPAVLCCAVLCCAVLCCAMLYCTVLYCTVLYCTVLYCTVLNVLVVVYHKPPFFFSPHFFWLKFYLSLKGDLNLLRNFLYSTSSLSSLLYFNLI